MPNKVSFIRIVILTALICTPVRSLSQDILIDTSEYIPIFFEGGIEYNLTIAATRGYSMEIERMILMGADVDAETSEGVTPLMFAVANNQLNAVNTFINYGADVNRITKGFETPLFIAVKNQNLEITETLLRNGADINFQNNYGTTPLHHSSIYGSFYITDLLLYYKAEIDRKDFDGTTPLMAAIWAGHADIVDLLIQNGANMEARDNDGFTAFLIAAQNGDTLLMNVLLRKGVDIYEINNFNWDALTLSIKSDQLAATEFLLKKGDKWFAPDRKAIDPYDVALKYRRKDIIDLLENKGISGKDKTGFDQMALSLNSRFNFKDIYAGVAISFKQPFLNAGFIAGFDTKLWYTRVLIKQSETLFYQYMDKSSVVYAGLFKDFALTDNLLRSNIFVYASLSAAYTFGNKLKGTEIAPESKLRVLPEIGFKWTKENFTLFSSIDYMNTDFFRPVPFWGRIGLSYNFFFDYVRAPGKIIKWY
ncbi:MAG: ankyrin repeat domain-containing protein [Bacteroidales bacterium]|nr:ankyrin repeat domain-containing protein [Bacteroidales bacterium]